MRNPTRHRRKPPKESGLSMLLDVEGQVKVTAKKEERFVAITSMKAVDGKLLLCFAAGPDAYVRVRISGLELHTALHALGFVRLNDRDGYG